MDTRLIPLGAAARMLHVPPRWLADEARAGRIPHLDAGGRLLVDVAAVSAALSERLTRHAPRRKAVRHAH
jgi:hypothetical protein